MHAESSETIAEAVGVTAGAVRQQLAVLDAAGLIAHRDERPGPGRPRRRYCLTPAAEGLWPKRYGQLTNQLLDFVGQESAARVLLLGRPAGVQDYRGLFRLLSDHGYEVWRFDRSFGLLPQAPEFPADVTLNLVAAKDPAYLASLAATT